MEKTILEKDFDLPEEQFNFLYSVIAIITTNDLVQNDLREKGIYQQFKSQWDAATVEERKTQLQGLYQLSVQAAEMSLICTNIVRAMGGEDIVTLQQVPAEEVSPE